MIRGLLGVVPLAAAEPGRFYLKQGYGTGPTLLQAVLPAKPEEGSTALDALYITYAGEPALEVHSFSGSDPLVALFDVHVRVDPTSLAGSRYSVHPQPGSLLVAGETPVLVASLGQRGHWTYVNLSTGERMPGGPTTDWLMFKRWFLVIDDEANEEVTIASFGTDAEDSA
jgi:hypothetical protein